MYTSNQLLRPTSIMSDDYPYVSGSEASSPLADSDGTIGTDDEDDTNTGSAPASKKKSTLGTILGAAAKGFQAGQPQQQYGGQRKNNLISQNMPSQQPQQNSLMNSFYQLGQSLGQRIRGGYDNGDQN